MQSVVRFATKHKLFGPFDFSIDDQDRIGVIGPNGAGKSTLLKTIGQIDPPDEGLVVASRSTFVTYVPQEEVFEKGLSIQDTLIERAKSDKVRPEEILGKVAVAAGLAGFYDMDVSTDSLSGGWKKRLSIVSGLIADAPLVLLDEPTNHLDFDGLVWLEQLLKRANFAWLAISHDRMFLSNCCKRMMEINTIYPDGVFATDANYDEFVIRKEQYLADQNAQIRNLKNKLRTEEEWLRRQPKARTTKSKSRIEAAHSMQSELGEKSSRLRQDQTKLGFSSSGRKSKKFIELTDCNKSIGEINIFENFTFTVTNQSRLAILGGNGAGKTTLLRILAGQGEVSSGKVERARDLSMVYFDQHRENLDDKLKLGDALGQDGDSVVYRDRSVHIITWAKRFGFSPDQLGQLVGTLSGGERAKVLIARLMLVQADILLLDEPTNDLDVDTIEQLEASIATFPGAVVLVSHDRYLIKRVCNQYLGFTGNAQLRSYGEFKQWQKDLKEGRKQKSAPPKSAKSSDSPAPAKEQRRLSYRDQREYDRMEKKIFDLEAEIEAIETQLSDPNNATNSALLAELAASLLPKKEKCEQMYARWAELESMMSS